MGEPERADSTAEGVAGAYRRLKDIAVSAVPERIIDARIERGPGDAPRNLRLFFTDGSFMDVWVGGEKYAYHWQGDDTVIRFDNAPHHDVETAPHHRHVDDSIEPSQLTGRPEEDIVRVLQFIVDTTSNSG